MSTEVVDVNSTQFWRQLDIIDYNKIAGLDVTMIGVGGLGSPTAMALAKMGVKKITVYDPDVVDIHNVPNQMYSVTDIGSYKADALEKICAGFGTEVVTKKEMYEKQPLRGIVIVGVDSMKARKIIWDSAKFSPNIPLLIDMRMGAEVGRIFTVRPAERDSIKSYEATLYDDSEAIELPCTAQAIIYNTLLMGGLAARIVKGYVMDEKPPGQIILDTVMYSIYTV